MEPAATQGAADGGGSRADTRSLMRVFGANFLSRYDVKERVGKGFYAKVHRCVERATGQTYAVKSIDVRPLRLRENFSRGRLMREVDILQRLDHPSIIRLVEATWNNAEAADHLLLVMEFAPGKELFDIIITEGKFSENDSRQIVEQLVSALAYCHARDIVHRDVKPENILLLSRDVDDKGSQAKPAGAPSDGSGPGGKFIVKLLDFGLSRTVGSSGAQTFAGTPEYFAPEVDPRRRAGGAKGSYGVAADCWSLGAVIFVMLSGVFPEFSGEGTNRRISFARPEYWGHISASCKDLISRLMHPNPNKRISMEDAAAHPWLNGLMREKGAKAKTGSEDQEGAPFPEDEDEEMTVTSSASEVDGMPPTNEMAKIRISSPSRAPPAAKGGRLRQGGTKRFRQPFEDEPTQNKSHTNVVADLSNVRLGADAIAFLETDHLFLLQNQLAKLFHDTYLTYAAEMDSQMTQTIRMHAVECRQLFKSSGALMNKLGGTATNVLNVMPDLRLGVEENEPELAEVFFTRIRGWIKEVKDESRSMMDKNSAAIRSLNISMENAKQGLFETVSGGITSSGNTPGKMKMICSVVKGTSPMIEELRPRGENLFVSDGANSVGSSSSRQSRLRSSMNGASEGGVASDSLHLSVNTEIPSGREVATSSIAAKSDALVLTPPRSPSGNSRKEAATAVTKGWQQRVRHLQQALAKLTQVDRILGGFSMFWDHMETSVTLLSQRNEHVESLLSFTKNPKLRTRFFDRLDEYKTMWLAVQMASTKYNRSDRGDDRSRHGQSGSRVHLGQNSARRAANAEGLYRNFLQLEDSNSNSRENLSAAAAAATAATNYSVPGVSASESASVSSEDVGMEIEHVESL